MITVSTIDNITGFAALREEWEELLHSSTVDCLFLSWEWLYIWWLNMSEDRTLFLVVVRRNEQLVAIAPMTIRHAQLRRFLPIRVMEFLGSGSVGSDYLDIIVRPGYESEALAALTREFTRSGLVLEMAFVDSKSPLLSQFAKKLSLLGWHQKSTVISCSPYVALSGLSWESYLASLTTKHRSVYLKKARKMHRECKVRLEMAVTEEQREKALAILIDLHLKRWNGHGGSNAFNAPELQQFHEQVSSAALARGWLRLYVLWLDDLPAAAVYGFEYSKAFYYYQAGYAPEFSHYSVGSMFIGMTIKIAIENGMEKYDFLHGNEEYKFDWARDARQMLRLDLFPPTVLGLVYQEGLRLRKILKTALAPDLAKKAHH